MYPSLQIWLSSYKQLPDADIHPNIHQGPWPRPPPLSTLCSLTFPSHPLHPVLLLSPLHQLRLQSLKISLAPLLILLYSPSFNIQHYASQKKDRLGEFRQIFENFLSRLDRKGKMDRSWKLRQRNSRPLSRLPILITRFQT